MKRGLTVVCCMVVRMTRLLGFEGLLPESSDDLEEVRRGSRADGSMATWRCFMPITGAEVKASATAAAPIMMADERSMVLLLLECMRDEIGKERGWRLVRERF